MLRFQLDAARDVLRERGFSGWLLYDFQGQNPIATAAIGVAGKHLTRRWYYWVPVAGEPVLVVHHIEQQNLPQLPGERIVYMSAKDLEIGLRRLVGDADVVAMEVYPNAAIPYLSRVDAGTVEWVCALGAGEVRSSEPLLSQLLCTWSDSQHDAHRTAVEALSRFKDEAMSFARDALQRGVTVSELDVQKVLIDAFEREGYITDHPPIVAVGAHAGDPHYAPAPDTAVELVENSVLLIDLWARLEPGDAAYGDLTYMAWIGPGPVPERIDSAFRTVLAARDAALETVRAAWEAGQPVAGWQVDRVARDLISERGFGDAFTHRTGHSLGTRAAHGDGPHLDDLETHDERLLQAGLGFTIEPGVYLPDEGFGIRSEIDVYMDPEHGPTVYGDIQYDWIIIDPRRPEGYLP